MNRAFSFFFAALPTFVYGQTTALTAGLSFEQDDCPCVNPKTGVKDPDICYYPACPAGYYKCCFDCEVSTCVNEGALNDRGNSGALELVMSTRGIFECIPCQPGDYCPGCDTYVECPIDDTADKMTPQISQVRSGQVKNCKKCPEIYEASVERDKCVPPFRDSCKMDLFEDCVSGCKYDVSEPNMRLGNIACEEIACRVYCAKQNTSKSCVNAFREECEELNKPRLRLPTVATLDMQMSSSEADLLLAADAGIATYEPREVDIPCNNICNSGFRSVVVGWGAIAMLVALLSW